MYKPSNVENYYSKWIHVDWSCLIIIRETWNVSCLHWFINVFSFNICHSIDLSLANDNNIMFVSILNRSMFRNPICAILLIFVYRIEFTLTEQPLNDHDHHPILHHSSWFIHFIKNLTDYFVIIIPVGLLVFLAKRDLLPSYGRCKMIFYIEIIF